MVHMALENIAGEMKTRKRASVPWQKLPFHASPSNKENSALYAFLQRNSNKLGAGMTYEKAVANWIFVLDTLNFCFWPEVGAPKYKVSVDGAEYTGHYALVATLERALRNDVPIIDAKWCAEVTRDELRRLFTNERGIEMPMLEERLKSLNDNGAVLLSKHGGLFSNCVQLANRSAKRLLEILVDDFEQFNDVSVFENVTVAFHKRAQILIADYIAAFSESDDGIAEEPLFNDAAEFLTAFADYRVPQILHYFGVLQYSPRLLELLRSQSLLKFGCREEIEIRGCTIGACEELRNSVREQILAEGNDGVQLAQSVSAVNIDNYLWHLRREIADQIESVSPFHRVRTIFY